MRQDKQTGEHLERLRGWRAYKDRVGAERGFAFLDKQFDREVARPHKQLGALAKVWEERVPRLWADKTAMSDLRHGVLTITVADSATLYRLAGLLRGGLEREMITKSPRTLRRVRLVVGSVETGNSGGTV